MLRRIEPSKRPIGVKVFDIKKLYPKIENPEKKKPKFYQK